MPGVKKAGVTMMKLNRNYTLASVMGHAVRFRKDEPTPVPNLILSEAVAIGAERVDGEPAIPEPDEKQDATPVHPNDREAALIDAIERLVERNERDEWTGTGLPKLAALSKEAGFKTDRSELSRVWQARAEKIALEERDGSS